MLRKYRKLPYLMMAFVLLLNLLSPSGLVSADAAAVGNAVEETVGTAPADAGNSSNDVTAEDSDDASKNDIQPISDSTIEKNKTITENIITGVQMKDENGNNLQEVRVDQGARVQVDVYWELPADHDYGKGSTFTFQLPDKFEVTKILTGDLDGNVGTYEVTPEGQVTFTFNEKIEGQGMQGNFYVWREFSEEKLSGGTHQDIVFDIHGDSFKVPVHFKSKSKSEIDKTGTPDKVMNPGKINWTVDVNKGEKKVTDMLFEDTLPQGVTLYQSSLQVYVLEVQLDGTVVEKGLIDPSKYAFTQTTGGFQLKFSGTSDTAYRVKYATAIDSPGDATYSNTVKVTGDGLTNPLEKTTGVPVKFSKPLGKEARDYNSATQTITWAIQYNYNEQTMPQDKAWIDDKFDTLNQELVDGSFHVYEMAIDANGNASKKTGTELVKDTDYTVTPNAEGFRFQFTKGVNAAYEITYQTKAKDRIHDDKLNVKNTVSMPNVPAITVGKDINQVIFWKSYTGIHYDSKTIDWKISLNDDNKTMTDVVITDHFAGQHMKLIPGSVKIGDLKKDVDYKLEADPDFKTGFKITFLHEISTNYVITYQTTFDPTAVKKDSYSNTAELNWKEGGVQQPSIDKTVSRPVDEYTQDNGGKTGSYDARTKEITWTLDVNYNLHEIEKAVVRDFYTGEQTFVEGSLVVQPLKLTGGANGVAPTGAPLSVDQDYTFKTDKKDGKDGFELKFNHKINSPYRITYKTSLVNHPVAAEYNNDAELYDESQPNTKLFEKSALVKPKFGGEYIVKTGVQGKGEFEDYAYWTLNINRSQSIVENAVVKDHLSANQILVPSSFKLYQTTVASNGNLSKGALVNEADYTLEVKDNSFTLTFKKPLHEAYVLEYQSFINAEHGEEISNNAEFAGQSSGAVDKNEDKIIKVSFAGAGGGAQPAGKGDLTLIKVDAAGGKPLEGARFGLYDKTGKTLLQELVTDAEGKAVFKNYKYNSNFIIKELSAPEGYLIDDAYLKGKTINFTKTADTVTVEDTKGVWDLELTKVDKDVPSKFLPGSVFKLQKHNGQVFEDVAGQTELETNENGKILLAHLTPGSYQLVEVKAPKGYKLDPTPIAFTIDANQSKSKQVTAKNEIYIGSVELTKTDAFNGAPLAGAEFDLKDEYGNTLKTGLTTDADGKLSVKDLKAGSYMFVEVAAPAGYELNSDPLKFEIVDDQLLQLSFKNDMTTGSVKLTKIQTGRLDVPLKGATFRILDSDKKPVKDKDGKEIAGLQTNDKGELNVSNLRPGKYYFEETAAPAGYTIKQALTEFEIVQGKETLVTVENNRITSGGGGGGGGTDPNPPVTPPVTPPVKPEEPDTPSVPGTVVDPDTPSKPGETTDPGKPGETTDPGKPGDTTNPGKPGGGTTPGSNGSVKLDAGNEHKKPGKGHDQGTTPAGDGSEPDPQSEGGMLPKTGEESHLPLQLAGLGLIVLGGALLLFRKMRVHHK
ncbi:collagen binding domain-containing protein [Paenibacillus mangrovi]|nr:collagen binding domain-containing protein [Paenibacillus mangrovi]